MKKITFWLLFGIVLFSCVVTGCHERPETIDPERPEIIDQGRVDLFNITIDSVTACCGVDSFTIKSPWLRQCIGSYLSDSASLKQELMIPYTICKLQDTNTGDDYIWIEIYQTQFTLYNCAGDTLQHCDTENPSCNYFQKKQDILSQYTWISNLVCIEIGIELYD